MGRNNINQNGVITDITSRADKKAKEIIQARKPQSCINDVMSITEWHCLDYRVTYSQLLERMIRQGIKKEEALDILSVAYYTAIAHTEWIP